MQLTFNETNSVSFAAVFVDCHKVMISIHLHLHVLNFQDHDHVSSILVRNSKVTSLAFPECLRMPWHDLFIGYWDESYVEVFVLHEVVVSGVLGQIPVEVGR